MRNIIVVKNIEEYADLIAALTREGLAFHGGCDEDGWWVEITGY